MSHDDDYHEHDEPTTVADAMRRWRYTLTPTLYVDENSDVNDLLWQQVLEQRATRGWLTVLCAVLGALALVLTIGLVV